MRTIDVIYSDIEEAAQNLWEMRGIDEINAQEFHEKVTIRLKEALAKAENYEFQITKEKIKT